MAPPPTILFVCYGNLCRSPLAEVLLRDRLAERGLDARYQVRSAGVIARRDNLPPPEAVKAAAEVGGNIRDHLSTPLTAELLDSSAMVIAMDRMNVEHILNLVPDLGPRLHLLKQFLPHPPDPKDPRRFDIQDPIGGSPEVYRKSYGEIAASITGLAERLAGAVTNRG
jgi:protein-tyrosine-phosphatase